MYTAQKTIERIQSLIKDKGLTQKLVLSECGISENTVKRMTDNKGISSFYLAKIADYLTCSVDYLLGRTDNPNITQNYSNNNFSNSNNIAFGENSNVNITKEIEESKNEIIKAISEIVTNLNLRNRSELLTIIYKFMDEHKNEE